MMIAQQEYAQRRELLMSKMGKGVAIFRSAPMAVMHNDVEYVYRQDSDFFYLTAFNESEAVAILAPNHDEHRFILFVQPKDLFGEGNLDGLSCWGGWGKGALRG